jgi:alkylated DNA repair dioxygenase AlkB
VPFGTVGLNYYRNGADSVAPHADRELRDLDDSLVAIVTLGARRPFLLRPKGGGRSVDLAPASGDLLVMGGACQAGWEHGVPKVARAGPRVSATWRWSRRVRATAAS